MKMLIGLLAGMFWFAGAAWGGDYTVNPNGTVTDNLTGLMWQREDDGISRTWELALVYCEDLTLDAQVDWRLPNMKELDSINDRSRYNPTIDPLVFTNWKIPYWSSTTVVNGTANAWYVSFDYGVVQSAAKGSYYFVRCVRGGE